MTVIEFFDKNAIENMLSALLCQPDKVVYIGSSKKQMDARLENYRKVLKARCLETELVSHSVGRNKLQSIVAVLCRYVEETDLCVFNLDGGDDLYLVAAGIIAQRYGSRVQLHRFNVRNNTITDCDADGNDQLAAPIRVSIDENIQIYGGRVIYEEARAGTTARWVMNEAFCRDIRQMWQICREDPGRWNWVFAQLDRLGRNEEENKTGLCTCIKDINRRFAGHEDDCKEIMTVLTSLEHAGILQQLQLDRYSLSFCYKDPQIKKCLLKAGTILELYVAVVAQGLFENDERIYHDVLSGVWLDWDGRLEENGQADVSNEIDVMLMCGAVPVFISCKNGDVGIDELYKLDTVSSRFGGKYAKKVLVLTQPEKLGSRKEAIELRAKEMGIRLLENIDEMPVQELESQLRLCWKQ